MSDLQVGSNIDSWCTKCKLVLAHTIEAVSLGTIKRVHCNTCKGKHKYRAAAPGTSVKKKTSTLAKSLAKKDPAAKSSSYAKAIKDVNVDKAKIYSPKEIFQVGDAVIHPTFGMGVVLEDKGDLKIEILFDSGSKILIHKRP